MKKNVLLMAAAGIVATGLAVTPYANAGMCDGSGDVKQACKKSCTPAGCDTSKAVKQVGSKTCTPAGCDMKQNRKCEDKSAKSCKRGCKKPCCASKSEVAEINTSGLKALLNSGVKVVVLDARSGKYDDGRRIPGADSLAANASQKQVRKAIRKKDALVVTYCSGLTCPASAMLAERLKELGYENVVEYPYGIQGWADAGLPVKNVKE